MRHYSAAGATSTDGACCNLCKLSPSVVTCVDLAPSRCLAWRSLLRESTHYLACFQYLEPCGLALQGSCAHQATPLRLGSTRRSSPRCVSNFDGYVSAFVFSVATQQTIGAFLLPNHAHTYPVAVARRAAQFEVMYRGLSSTDACLGQLKGKLLWFE